MESNPGYLLESLESWGRSSEFAACEQVGIQADYLVTGSQQNGPGYGPDIAFMTS